MQGRYPFHWHRCGNVQGQFIRRSSIHDSYQRCITIHASNMAQVVGNTCVNIFGHAYFLEDGIETGNLLEENIAIFVKKMPRDRALLKSDWFDFNPSKFPAPSAFWISHPWNRVKNNVAIASEGTGFWMTYVNVVCCTAGLVCNVPDAASALQSRQKIQDYTCEGDLDVLSPRPLVTHRPALMAQFIFDGNTAASNLLGFTWDAAHTGKLRNNPLNPNDRELVTSHFSPTEHPTIRRFTTYKNSRRGLYTRGDPMTFEGCVEADNGVGTQTAFNTLLKDYLSVGWSRNFEIDFFFDTSVRRATFGGDIRPYRLGFYTPSSALMMYDGPLMVENAHFAGYVNANARKNGVDVTPAVLVPLGVADRLVNRAQSLSFESAPGKRAQMAGAFQPTAAMQDPTGQLSGFPGTDMTILPDVWINWSPECRRTPALVGAIACPGHRIGIFKFVGGRGPAKLPSGQPHRFPYSVLRTNGMDNLSPTSPSLTWSGDLEFVAIMNKGFSYSPIWWQPTDQDLSARFVADRVGDVSPPIYFRTHLSTAGCPLADFRALPARGATELMPRFTSERELVTGNKAGIHYKPGIGGHIVMRVQTTEPFGVGHSDVHTTNNLGPSYAPSRWVGHVEFWCKGKRRWPREMDASRPDRPLPAPTQLGRGIIMGETTVHDRQANGDVVLAGWACAKHQNVPVSLWVYRQDSRTGVRTKIGEYGTTALQAAVPVDGKPPVRHDTLRDFHSQWTCGTSQNVPHHFRMTVPRAANGGGDDMLAVRAIGPDCDTSTCFGKRLRAFLDGGMAFANDRFRREHAPVEVSDQTQLADVDTKAAAPEQAPAAMAQERQRTSAEPNLFSFKLLRPEEFPLALKYPNMDKAITQPTPFLKQSPWYGFEVDSASKAAKGGSAAPGWEHLITTTSSSSSTTTTTTTSITTTTTTTTATRATTATTTTASPSMATAVRARTTDGLANRPVHAPAPTPPALATHGNGTGKMFAPGGWPTRSAPPGWASPTFAWASTTATQASASPAQTSTGSSSPAAWLVPIILIVLAAGACAAWRLHRGDKDGHGDTAPAEGSDGMYDTIAKTLTLQRVSALSPQCADTRVASGGTAAAAGHYLHADAEDVYAVPYAEEGHAAPTHTEDVYAIPFADDRPSAPAQATLRRTKIKTNAYLEVLSSSSPSANTPKPADFTARSGTGLAAPSAATSADQMYSGYGSPAVIDVSAAGAYSMYSVCGSPAVGAVSTAAADAKVSDTGPDGTTNSSRVALNNPAYASGRVALNNPAYASGRVTFNNPAYQSDVAPVQTRTRQNSVC